MKASERILITQRKDMDIMIMMINGNILKYKEIVTKLRKKIVP